MFFLDTIDDPFDFLTAERLGSSKLALSPFWYFTLFDISCGSDLLFTSVPSFELVVATLGASIKATFVELGMTTGNHFLDQLCDPLAMLEQLILSDCEEINFQVLVITLEFSGIKLDECCKFDVRVDCFRFGLDSLEVLLEKVSFNVLFFSIVDLEDSRPELSFVFAVSLFGSAFVTWIRFEGRSKVVDSTSAKVESGLPSVLGSSYVIRQSSGFAFWTFVFLLRTSHDDILLLTVDVFLGV